LFSDHNCVRFDFIAEKVTASQKIRRTIYDYKRADFEGMNQALEMLEFDWMTNDSTSDINDD
jgi:hypothetical protein